MNSCFQLQSASGMTPLMRQQPSCAAAAESPATPTSMQATRRFELVARMTTWTSAVGTVLRPNANDALSRGDATSLIDLCAWPAVHAALL